MEQNIILSWGHIWVIIAGLFGAGAFFYKFLDKKLDKLDDRLASFEKNAEHRLTKLEMEVKNTNQRLSTIESFLIPKKVYQFENPEPPHTEHKEVKEN